MNPRTGLKGQSYGNTGTPITMDMGGFRIQYRNALGGNRESFFQTSDHNEARQEFNQYVVGREGIDETPLRIERFDIFGNHTDTWTCDNNWDSCLIKTWSDRDEYENRVGNTREEYERQERRRYRRYSNRSGDRV